ncbi:MAG TPA: DUF2339 domain-containing protein, partial [Candidatus Thermoplasmatota archaeon]|nr:DUF2339 domain-containing protein [Candidatus Thermoplasmatota archaeon]
PAIDDAHRGPALGVATAFAALWAFALFHAPLAVGAWLVLLGLAALAAARRDAGFAYAALALLGVAAAKAAVFDAGLPAAQVYAEGLLVAVALLALVEAVGARRVQTHDEARLALVALAGVALVAGLANLWRDVPGGRLAATAAFALGGLALGLLARGRAGDAWLAPLGLGLAAAGHAVLREGRIVWPGEPSSTALGGWEAWAALVLVAGALWLVLAASGADRTARRLALVGLLAFLTAWAFAVAHAPFLVTLVLLAVAGLAVLAARALPDDADRGVLAAQAAGGALLVLAVAALKGATLDTHGPQALPWTLAAVEAGLTAGALLALHHLARDRAPLDPRASGVALVGGSALVLANVVLAYAEGPLPSILLAALGVAYLAAGFLLRRESVHRYTGFALLGFVLLRVFVVDLNETDLAIRALVFAVLGAILLGVGYAYARMSRKEAAAEPAPGDVTGPGGPP